MPSLIKMIVITFIGVALGIVVIGLLVAEIWTLKVQADPRQKTFTAGVLPSPLPNGFYRGGADSDQGKWVGKSFDLSTMTGLNHFSSPSGASGDPFKFYTGQAVKDSNLQVLKIDYNIPQNPWWLRHLLDEVVETDQPGHYLGKLHVRWIGLTFTLGYFNLVK